MGNVLSVVSELLASAQSVRFLPRLRLTLRLTLCLRELTSTPPSPVLVSRTCAWTTSRSVSTHARRFFVTPRSPRTMFTSLSLLEDPPVFQRSRTCSPSTSTERSSASPSTQTRLSPTELLFRLLSSLVPTSPRSSLIFSFLMSPHFPLDLRLLEES